MVVFRESVSTFLQLVVASLRVSQLLSSMSGLVLQPYHTIICLKQLMSFIFIWFLRVWKAHTYFPMGDTSLTHSPRNRPCTTTPEFPKPPVKMVAGFSPFPSPPWCFLSFVFTEWLMDNKPIICHLLHIFDRWWEALQGRVFWRARVKEIRQSNGRPCRFWIKVCITF